DRARAPPADRRRVYERIDDAEHADGGEDCADRIEALDRRLLAVVREQTERTGEDERANGQVDEEHPAPTDGLGEHASGKDADDRAERDRRTPDPDRLGAVLALAEGGGQDRERGRRHHRRTQALREASTDQDGLATRETAGK